MKKEKSFALEGYTVKAKMDGLWLRVAVYDEKGQEVDWSCTESNEGRGLAFTTDNDLNERETVHLGADADAVWDRIYARAEKDPELKRAACVTNADLKAWRMRKTEAKPASIAREAA